MQLTSDHRTENQTAGRGSTLSDRATYIGLAIVLVAVFLVYANTFSFDFVHDDRPQILGNTWLRSWRFLPRYFTADVWAFQHPVFRGTFYRPIFLLWLRLQYIVFGLKPWGWHLATVLCNVAVTVLVYFTAEWLLEDRLAALFTAMIFGLHPTHAEGVAWISGVTEPLFALFLFAAYLCYLKLRRDPGRRNAWLAASIFLYILACLSKETAVILPLIIFADEVIWAGEGGDRAQAAWTVRIWQACKTAAPYVLVFVLYLVARLFALQGFQNTKEPHSYLAMFLTWPSVLWFYIQHLFWPVRLDPFYTREFYSHVDLHHVLLPAIPVGLAAVGLWIWSRRSQKAAIATLWMVIPILPVLNLRAFIEGHLVHDRYLYLPTFGFAMLVAMGIRKLKFKDEYAGLPVVQIGLTTVIGVLLGIGVYKATACYANEYTYFAYVSSVSPEGHSSKLDLAGILGNQGHLDQAIQLYKEILPEQPDNWDVNYNLGYAYYVTGKLSDADHFLTRATQLDGSRPDGFFYLGLTKLKENDLNAAAANVQRAVAVRPDADHYHFALGVIFKVQGNLPGALSEFHQEMEISPGDDSARQQADLIESELASKTHAPAQSSIQPH